jgi:hypothetical protein
MKIRISELTALERAKLKVNVVNAHGESFYEKCVEEDAPVIGTIDVTSTIEGPEFWINVLTEGNPTSENLLELTQRTIQVMEDIIGESITPAKNNGELVVGKWYCARDGRSRDIISMFRYNGKSHGRVGWNEDGEWRNDLDDSLDEFLEPAPIDMVTLAFTVEARKRGYALGVNTIHGLIESDDENEYNQRGVDEDYFFFHNIKVYKDGDWGHCSIVNQATSSTLNESDRIEYALKQLIEKLAKLN